MAAPRASAQSVPDYKVPDYDPEYWNRSDEVEDVLGSNNCYNSTPEHLLSKEVFARIHRMLNPGGLLTLNFVGGVTGPEGEATLLVGQTMRAEFPHVRAFMDDSNQRITNVIFFASDADLQIENVQRVRFPHRAREEARHALLEHELPLRSDRSARIITEAFNPLNRLELPIAETHAAAMNQLFPADVWLN